MSVNLVKLCAGVRVLAEGEHELREGGEPDRADKVWEQIAEMVEMASKMPAETRAGFTSKTMCLVAIVEVRENRNEHVAVQALRRSVERDEGRFGRVRE